MIAGIGKRISAVCFACAVLSAATMAQQIPQRQPAPSLSRPAPVLPEPAPSRKSPPAAESVSPGVIEVTMNKAQSVDLPAPVKEIVIGNEAVADVRVDPNRPRQVFVLAKAVGSTNVFFVGDDGGVIHQLEVRVIFDHQGLKAALAQFLPDEKIDVGIYRDSVFLTGKLRSATTSAQAVAIARRFVGAASDVVNMLTMIGSQQVIMQVRISEMARTLRKNLQVAQVLSHFNSDRLTFTTHPSSTAALFATGTLSTLSNLGPTSFSVLERQGLVKTLAEPTLTALSGQTASFLSGQQTPSVTGVDQNGNAVIEYRDLGIRLSFTPTVIDENRINLKVSTEISSIGTTVNILGATLPNYDVKNTETTIDLPSGGSLMIAGLLKDDMDNTVDGFPYLKDIPVLGALFRSHEFLREETELVVTVAVYLAKPTGADAPLALPSDGFEPASDIDLYLLGRLHREYAKKELPIWAAPLKGPFGYIME